MDNYINRKKIVAKRAAYIIFLSVISFSSCEKIVEVDFPRGSLSRATVFEDDLTAAAAVNGLYTNMASTCYLNIALPVSLAADDLKMNGNSYDAQFYQNEVSSTNTKIQAIWTDFYRLIYRANSIIEGLGNSKNLTTSLKNQLMGEAKFSRAFCHFHLLNLFGDVPFLTSTNYEVNALASRTPVSQVYEQIITDLVDARSLLLENYSYSDGERVRANKWAATAMLARVYLYQQDWIQAEELSTSIIINSTLFSLKTNLNEVFLQNSRESILQFIPDYPQEYTIDGERFINASYLDGYPTVNPDLFDFFEPGDNRKSLWLATGYYSGNTWYYAVKYKKSSSNGSLAKEYSMILRLAEQYLIRAEARAHLGKLTGINSAESDINVIRNRAGLLPVTITTKDELLLSIEKERRAELFTELGHRWFDLKRTGRLNAIMSALKPGWQPKDTLFPIPDAELRLNPNLTPNPSN